MNIKEIRQNTILKLQQSEISSQEASVEVNILMDFVFGINKKDLILNPEKVLPEDEIEKFNSLIERRIKEKIPVQYLTNKAYFMGEEFYVDENVLIPRPETEILIEQILGLIRFACNDKILDIGTGSGCIACMIAKMSKNVEVFACDISEKALEVAQKNTENLGVTDKVNFIRSDLFENIPNEIKFDIIVSNPPYIPEKEKSGIQPEVLLHEPHSALFVPDEKGVSFYKKLASEAKDRLEENGFLAVEIGINQSDEVSDIFQKAGFKEIKIIKDYAGIDRVAIAKC